MTLNDWSLIVFAVTAIYMFSLYISMFRPPAAWKFAVMFVVWLGLLVTYVVYGIATGQVGFIFIAALELMMIGFTYTIAERSMKNDDN